jgi:hypothetical protein
MLKKIALVAIFSMILGISFWGCSPSETPQISRVTEAPVTEAPTTAPNTTQPSQPYEATRLDEIMMVETIQESTGLVEGWDFQADTVIDTAYLICGNLRQGTSPEEIMGMVNQSASNELTRLFLTAVTAGAITYICPDMAYLLD